jgi:hypothetical protein
MRSCVAACVAGSTCTPAGTPDPCKTYTTACASSTALPACTTLGNKADGTDCGGGNVCSAGNCIAAARTVSGTIQTIYEKDDLTTTTVAGAPFEYPILVTAILVADNSEMGYSTFPVQPDATTKAFSVSNVPVGHYFLQIDQPSNQGYVNRTWYEMTTNSPDLTIHVGGRSDRAAQMQNPTPVTYDLTLTAPWSTTDSMIVVSSQATAYNRPRLNPAPAVGALSFSGTEDWLTSADDLYGIRAGFLPNAAKGDTTYVYHRSTIAVGGGNTAGKWRHAAEYLKRTDLTVTDGIGAGISGTLAAAPQTGSLSGDWRSSQFAILASAVNPSGVTPGPTGYVAGPAVFTVPYSIRYPILIAAPLSFYGAPDGVTDVNYGTLHYGQFLESFWKEYVQVLYPYTGSLSGGTAFAEFYYAAIPIASAPATWAPTLSPPTAPKINGADAFSTHSGVGTGPTISWAGPAIGTATHYVVSVSLMDPTPPQAGDVVSVAAIVHTGTSFKVPGWFLKPGRYYSANVTSVSSQDSLDSPLFGAGLPYTSIGCDFGLITP